MENTLSAAGAAGVLLGVLLVGLGVAWPLLGSGPSEANKQTASDYLAAAQKMEAAVSMPKKERAAAIEAARAEYQSTKEEIVTLKGAGQRTAFWMKLGGALLAAAGVGGLMAGRSE